MEKEAATKVSFWLAHLLGKQGKPLTYGGLIQSCVMQQLKKHHQRK